MRAGQESEVAQAKLIEEMVNFRLTMEEATNLQIQQQFLADRAHKAVQAMVVEQGSASTAGHSEEEVQEEREKV